MRTKQPSVMMHVLQALAAVAFAFLSVLMFAGVTFGCSEDWGRPKGDVGLAYCLRQCDTATLRLTSIELRDHSDGNTVVCHCEVRPESLTGYGHIYLAPGERMVTRAGNTLEYLIIDGGAYVRTVESRLDEGAQ